MEKDLTEREAELKETCRELLHLFLRHNPYISRLDFLEIKQQKFFPIFCSLIDIQNNEERTMAFNLFADVCMEESYVKFG